MKRLALGLGIAALIVVGLAARSLTSVTPASAVVSASLAIDADTSDGCAVIQSTANITQGTATSVGICIVDAAAAPVSGFISLADLNVSYTAPLTASNVASDLTTDLASNPDWDQTVGGGAGPWDCNALNMGSSAPTANPSPATMSCDSGVIDEPVSGNVLLATLNFDAAGSLGTSTLAFGVTDLSTGAAGVNNPVCGAGFTCTGASITVQAPPTATDTATATSTNTPTATNTPCPGAPCTPTPVPTATTATTSGGRTNTPAATKTATAAATGTTGAARTATRAAGVATQPGGGAGAGGTVRLPNTGSQPSGGSGAHSWLWLAMTALAAAGIGGAMALTARRHRR